MASGFSVTISATDRATAAIDTVNKKLASITAPMEKMGKSLSKFGDVSGINKVAGGLTTVAKSAVGAARSLASVIAPLGAITSAASLAGIVHLTDAWGTFGQRLGFAATRIGTTAEKLYALQGAARLVGVSGDAASSGLRTLSDTLTDAVGGRNAEAIYMFRTLGIEFRNLDGSARKAEDVLPQIADKIAALKNPSLQARVAVQLLGAAGEEMLPFLRKGAAGMAEYEAKARKFGVFNEAGAKAANEMAMAQAELELAIKGTGYAVAQQLAPALIPMLHDLSQWVAAHRDDIGRFFKNMAAGFKSWVEGGGIDRMLAKLESIGKLIVYLIDKAEGFARSFGLLGDNPDHHLKTFEVPKGMQLPPGGKAPAGTPAWKRLLWGVLPDSWKGGGRAAPASADASGAVSYFMGKGWSAAQAAGIAANLQAESGFRPGEVGDGGQAYGLAQWHPDRQAAFKARFGKDIRQATSQEQLDFVHYELTEGSEKAAGDRLRLATLPGEAGDIVSQYYERPADRFGEAQRRSSLAQNIARIPVSGPYTPSLVAGTRGDPGAAGTVKVEISHRNPPPGTTTKVSTTGNVDAAARVERSMPPPS